MRMRKVNRMVFDNPAVKNNPLFAFDPQRAANAFFDAKWMALQRAKAAAAKAAAAKSSWELRLPLFFCISNILFNYILYI